ncbi:MAG: hypothetical protein AAFY24_07155 [Pseudomonadota bacterium]
MNILIPRKRFSAVSKDARLVQSLVAYPFETDLKVLLRMKV